MKRLMAIIRKNAFVIVGLCIFAIIGIMAYRSKTKEYFDNDEDAEEVEDTSSDPPITLDNNTDYQDFYKWNTDFCETWNKILDQVMKVDQTSLSKEEYIKVLETKNITQLVNCNPEITKSPDPIKVLPVIPTNTILYVNTLNFMAQQISNIKRQTEEALQGASVPKEGFENQNPNQCACTSTTVVVSAKTIAAKANAINEIVDKLKAINPAIAKLQGKLAIVKAGLQDLDTYKKKAEDGTLVNDIHISE